jgi:IS5 family transposase
MINLFGENERLIVIDNLGDPLAKLNKYINWDIFKGILNEKLNKDRSKGGRPPYSYLLMFKILILQRIYNISDDSTEFQINDRLTFQRFLGIKNVNKIPDAKTIWHFRDEIAKLSLDKELFGLFSEILENEGIITHEGSIIDASFVECPKQRNTREENEKIKKGEELDWSINKRRQKDKDAKWTKKNNTSYYGYKNHAKVDKDSKMIVNYETTPANVHDSQVYSDLMDEKDKQAYADSAYINQEVPNNIIQHVVARKFKNKELTDDEKRTNKAISKIRCRVEHVFGFIENSMNGSTFRGKGLTRAKLNVGITNLVYNLCRYAFLKNISKSVG